MAGGTGGHIFPGIAIAQYLLKMGWKIVWLGTHDRMEVNLIQKYNFHLELIRVKSWRREKIKSWLPTTLQFSMAVHQAYKIIKNWHPHVVLGMGGYISGPGGIAAWMQGIPIVIHEQNVIPGLTNYWLAKIACKKLQAFPGALHEAIVVGNPIRDEIRYLPPPESRFSGRNLFPLRVLVLGGSQGAQILNHVMPQVAHILGNKIHLWHQVGKNAFYQVRNLYKDLSNFKYRITEFIEDIARAYSWADVVICRSGALTVSEIALVGLPAIFVPFQHRDKQQYCNALLLKDVNAAKILETSEFTAVNVVKILEKLDRTTLLSMALCARSIAKFDATECVASHIINISKNYT